MKVIVPPEVEDEIEAIYLHVAERAPRAAAAWYNGCIDAIKSLGTFPERCALAPECPVFGRELRHLIYGNYRIIFAVQHGSVQVLHVRHAARRTPGPDPAEG